MKSGLRITLSQTVSLTISRVQRKSAHIVTVKRTNEPEILNEFLRFRIFFGRKLFLFSVFGVFGNMYVVRRFETRVDKNDVFGIQPQPNLT